MTKSLEQIYRDSQQRGEDWESVIRSIPKMSDILFDELRRLEMINLWRSRKIHGWMDQKGRVHYPE